MMINVNQYGAMLSTQTEKRANRLVTRIHNVSLHSSNLYSNNHNLQLKDLILVSSREFLSRGADFFLLSKK